MGNYAVKWLLLLLTIVFTVGHWPAKGTDFFILSRGNKTKTLFFCNQFKNKTVFLACPSYDSTRKFNSFGIIRFELVLEMSNSSDRQIVDCFWYLTHFGSQQPCYYSFWSDASSTEPVDLNMCTKKPIAVALVCYGDQNVH